MIEDTPFRPTVAERLILANQYRILERMYPDEAQSYREKRTILEAGYELHYRDVTSILSVDGLATERCRRVMDILDMYRALRHSYQSLQDKGAVAESDVSFKGFDGNAESDLMFYAQFLILTQGRWQEVLEGRPNFEMNSHSDLSEMYDRMLTEWTALERKFELSLEEIVHILDSRPHPDNT